MSDNTPSPTEGPYRISRDKEGVRAYFAGHHTNGQPHWVDSFDDAIRYPDERLAATVHRSLDVEDDSTTNVVRIDV